MKKTIVGIFWVIVMVLCIIGLWEDGVCYYEMAKERLSGENTDNFSEYLVKKESECFKSSIFNIF